MSDDCGQTLLLQAEFDGELDAAQSAALAAHRASCGHCRANWAALEAARETARTGLTYHAAPESLRAALRVRLAPAASSPPQRRLFWREPLSFALGTALAAVVALMLWPAGGGDGVLAALVDDHVRSLEPGHFYDVASSDKHTVKPWFDGKLDFAPPVKDLASDGYPLVGGRLDYLGGRAVAALAYMHGKHPINLFVWPAKDTAPPAEEATRDGYNVVHWQSGGMSLWAVSDVEKEELEAFARDWQKTP